MDEQKRPKRPRGRPPRVPGERLERVAINVRSSILFGLDLLARDRRTSLSQAAEFALTAMFQRYLIEGRPLSKWLEMIEMVEESPNLPVAAFRGPAMSEERKREIIHKFYIETGYARVLVTPPSLRTAAEKFLFDVLQVDGGVDFTQSSLLMDLVDQGMKNGWSPEATAKAWHDKCSAAKRDGAGFSGSNE